MSSHEPLGFLRLGAVVCLLDALMWGADALLPQDGGTADIVGDFLVCIGSYVLIGLAWGLIALRPGPLAKVAAALLLVNLLSTLVIGLVSLPTFVLELLSWLRPIAIAALAAALAWGRPRDLVVALIAVGGAVAVVIAGASEPLWLGGFMTTSLALATLFELSRARAPIVRSDSARGPWRQTDAGVRLFVMGERGRLMSVIGVFVLGAVLPATHRKAVLDVLWPVASLLTLAISTIGLVRMCSAPIGRPWLLAALGMACVAFLAVISEILGKLLGSELLVSDGTLEGIISRGILPSFAVLALGTLGERAGVAHAKDDARGTAWTYLFAFVVIAATQLMYSLGVLLVFVVIAGFAAIVLFVWATHQLLELGTQVRSAPPTANDL